MAPARLPWKQLTLHVTILTAAACLFGVFHLAVGGARERLLVGDLRLADHRLDAELALQAVDDDFQMELTHAADDRLAGLDVRVHAKRSEERRVGKECRSG